MTQPVPTSSAENEGAEWLGARQVAIGLLLKDLERRGPTDQDMVVFRWAGSHLRWLARHEPGRRRALVPAGPAYWSDDGRARVVGHLRDIIASESTLVRLSEAGYFPTARAQAAEASRYERSTRGRAASPPAPALEYPQPGPSRYRAPEEQRGPRRSESRGRVPEAPAPRSTGNVAGLAPRGTSAPGEERGRDRSQLPAGAPSSTRPQLRQAPGSESLVSPLRKAAKVVDAAVLPSSQRLPTFFQRAFADRRGYSRLRSTSRSPSPPGRSSGGG
jgi:hypothetical protein